MIRKAMVPLEDGTIMYCDVTEYDGLPWLVPHWLDMPDGKWTMPARIICLVGCSRRLPAVVRDALVRVFVGRFSERSGDLLHQRLGGGRKRIEYGVEPATDRLHTAVVVGHVPDVDHFGRGVRLPFLVYLDKD